MSILLAILVTLAALTAPTGSGPGIAPTPTSYDGGGPPTKCPASDPTCGLGGG